MISLTTLLIYTGLSFRLAFAKRMRKSEAAQAAKKKNHNPEANGMLSAWFPYVSSIAWSTLDLASIYVSQIFSFKKDMIFNARAS